MDFEKMFIYAGGLIFCIWLITSELKSFNETNSDEDELTSSKNRIRGINIVVSAAIVLIILLWLIYKEL